MMQKKEGMPPAIAATLDPPCPSCGGAEFQVRVMSEGVLLVACQACGACTRFAGVRLVSGRVGAAGGAVTG